MLNRLLRFQLPIFHWQSAIAKRKNSSFERRLGDAELFMENAKLGRDHADALESQWTKIESQIAKESGLVLQWLVLLILINAGLVAAFAQFIGTLPTTQIIDASSGQTLARSLVYIALLFGIPITGILSSGFIVFAVTAAADQFEYLRQAYFSMAADFEKHGWPRPFGDENEDRRTSETARFTYRFYGRPTIIPRAFQIFWLVILVASIVIFLHAASMHFIAH